MGDRGPAPTPSAKMKLVGYRDDRANPADEPQPNKGKPEQSEILKGYALEVWESTTEELDRIGVIATIDGNALTRYCVLMAEWVKMFKIVDADGGIYTTVDALGNTNYKKRPELAAMLEINRELLTLEKHYGLTPSARTRLTVSQSMPKNDEQPTLGSFQIG